MRVERAIALWRMSLPHLFWQMEGETYGLSLAAPRRIPALRDLHKSHMPAQARRGRRSWSLHLLPICVRKAPVVELSRAWTRAGSEERLQMHAWGAGGAAPRRDSDSHGSSEDRVRDTEGHGRRMPQLAAALHDSTLHAARSDTVQLSNHWIQVTAVEPRYTSLESRVSCTVCVQSAAHASKGQGPS